MIVAQILAAAARAPERTAVICGDERLSYRALVERSGWVAGALRARGVGCEDLVTVEIEPSPWMVIAILGILRAGAAYVPLDPAYPAARLAEMRAQLGAAIELERGWAEGGATADVTVAADALAYVIFTSGSTGRPKGVMVPHRGLANLVAAQIDAFEIDTESVVLQFAPLSFDASVSEIFTALAAGATLCLAPRDELVGDRLAALVRRHGVTVMTLPPSSLALLDPDALPSVRTVVSAGEACSAALVARWAPGRRMVNAYGPTEVTVCATMGVCVADPAGQAPGLGVALPGVTVQLLDGEIVVGGIGVARGYLGRPGLTAERFVPDPDGGPGARRYRTGDLARRRADASLEFLGRIDHQVKIRGHRVELGEVEAALRSAPGVRDALVIAREDRPGDVRLVGYVIGELTAVRAAIEARLPAYARPSALVALDDWPRSPAGKIDRARLPAPIRAASQASARSDLELRVAEIWQAVLGGGAVGPDDDFFAIGGHSLLAIRVLSRIREALGVDLPLSVMTAHSTVAALAQVIAARGGQAPLRSPLALRAAGRAAPLFLLPPVSGSALVYLPLVRRLAADRPIHAFHAPGLDGASAPPATIAALAAHFIRELLAHQPRGPHLLGGWSIGGAVAFEMAVQLAAMDHAVPELILIDSTAPTPYLADGIKAKFGQLTDALVAFMYVNNFARCFGVELGLERARFTALSADAIEPSVLRELRRVPGFAPDVDPARLRHHLAVFAATLRGFAAWQPTVRYAGRLRMLSARDGHPEFGAARADWSSFVTGGAAAIETVEVPGNHFSLINAPHVDALAGVLDAVLSRLP